jgi:dihydrofolate synthase/folylpolyglutamate synthase
MTTYPELLAHLFAARRFGMQLGLERMEAALAALGHPERQLGAVIHVAGTNGKGSTCAFIEACLRAAGHRTALYTSPHLCRFTERIQVDGLELAGEDLARHWAAARDVLEPLTFFEQATCLAFLAIAEQPVDVTVLEVGLGGRFDATNVVEADVAVVTGVALDHQEHLGSTIEAIAREKAGIFKRDRAVVIGCSGDPAGRAILEAEAGRAEASSVTLAPGPVVLPLGLSGEHQARNAATALAALDALARVCKVRVSAAARAAGLRSARWPGRLERFGDLWLDGAHNPDGAAALAQALAQDPAPLSLMIGVSADKDVPGIAGPLARLATLVIASTAPSERALPARELARQIDRLPGPAGRQVVVEADARAAFALLRAATGRKLVAGSLFLVGAVRALLTGEALDPVTVSDPVKAAP